MDQLLEPLGNPVVTMNSWIQIIYGNEKMKKLLLIILLPLSFLFYSARAKHPEYQLTICAIFQNEAPYLKQWIDFHHEAIGVSHFYLYNNDSTDNFREILDPYIDQGLVELIEWNSSDDHAVFGVHDYLFVPYQLGAYRDCLKNRAYGQAKWVAMLDIDEYIVPKDPASLYRLLKKGEKEGVGSLKIHWKMFGTSHVQDLEPGERLVEKLVRRGPDDFFENLDYVKSIHQPEAAFEHCGTHIVHHIKEGYRIEQVPPEECRIHHYWSGTENRCNEKRVFKSPEDKKACLDKLNAIEDFSIYPYLEHLSPLD